MFDPATLNRQWAREGAIHFDHGPGGLPVAHLSNPAASAVISLYGAHLLSYVPAGGTDILWMSNRSHFEAGKAIRGGIPVCFPWFGPHPGGEPYPQHGFGRLMFWRPCSAGVSETGTVLLELELLSDEATRRYFPGDFRAVLRLELDESCHLELRIQNTGTAAFDLSGALHTYFRVSDIHQVNLEGLQGVSYINAGETFRQEQTTPLLVCKGEVNRRYLDITHACLLHDPGLNRTIHIDKNGSRVTVVWNPWEKTCQQIPDMEPEAYRDFLCIEPANAVEGVDIIHLQPGAVHVLGTILSVTS